jgi:pimeloyl-ACP methyl ester carboxylesterase
VNKNKFIFKDCIHEYLTIGADNSGAQHAIIAFHGFGRKAEDFGIFESCLKPNQVIYSFNLLGHGKSKFQNSNIQRLDPADFAEIILEFIQSKGHRSFSLLGYSMGGKVCMMLLQHLNTSIDGFFLIAPDGVKMNRYYRFASTTALGKWLFNGVVNYPAPVLRFTDFMKFIGIFNAKLHKFIHLNMEDKTTRALVRDVWIMYADFIPDIKLVQAHLNEGNIHTVLIYGRHDSVIKSWQGEKLNQGLNKDSLHMLDTGHLLLEGRTISYVQQNNLWFPS